MPDIFDELAARARAGAAAPRGDVFTQLAAQQRAETAPAPAGRPAAPPAAARPPRPINLAPDLIKAEPADDVAGGGGPGGPASSPPTAPAAPPHRLDVFDQLAAQHRPAAQAWAPDPTPPTLSPFPGQPAADPAATAAAAAEINRFPNASPAARRAILDKHQAAAAMQATAAAAAQGQASPPPPDLIPAELDTSLPPTTPTVTAARPAPAAQPPDLIPAELADGGAGGPGGPAGPVPTVTTAAAGGTNGVGDDERRAQAAAWIQQHTPRNHLAPGATEDDVRHAFAAERGQVMPPELKGTDPAERAEWTRREQERFFHTPKPQQGTLEEAGNFGARAAASQGTAIGGAAQLLGRGMQAVGLDSSGKAVRHFGEDFADANRNFIQEHAASPNRAYLDPLAQAAGDTAAVLAGGELGKAAGRAAAPLATRLVGEAGADAATKAAQNVGQRAGLGVVGGIQAGGNTKDAMRRQGIDQRVSDLAGVGMGVVGALVGQLFGASPATAQNLLRRIGTLALEGGTASAVQGAAGEAVRSAATGDAYRKAAPLEAGVTGALGAGLTGAATEGLGRLGEMFKDLFANNRPLRDYFRARAMRAKTAAEAAAVGEEARQAAEDFAGAKQQQQQQQQGPNPYDDFRRRQSQERQQRDEYRRQSEQAKAAPPPGKMTEAAAREELGLDPKGDVYAEDVKAAFRRRVLQTHPDSGGNDGAVKRTIEARELLEKLYGSRTRPRPSSPEPQPQGGPAGDGNPTPPPPPAAAADVSAPAAEASAPSPSPSRQTSSPPAAPTPGPAEGASGDAGGGQVTGFRTAHGSEYAFADGRTQRNKSPHVGHDPADVGLKPPSDRTVFVDPETATRIGMHNSLNAEARPRVSIEGDKVVLTSQYGPGYGKTARQEYPYSATPEVGKAPLELWSDGRNHPGNPITEIRTAAGAAAPAQPTPPPAAADVLAASSSTAPPSSSSSAASPAAPTAAGDAAPARTPVPAAEPGQRATDYYRTLLARFPDGTLPDGRRITGRMVRDAVHAAGSAAPRDAAAAPLVTPAAPEASATSSAPAPSPSSPPSSSPSPEQPASAPAAAPAGRPDPRRVFANWLKEPASPAAGLPEQRDLTQVLGHGRPVYHETNPAGAARLIARVQQGPRSHSPIYVSDNQDLAFGQGGRGVVLEFDPSYTNGFKPRSVQNAVLGAAAGQGAGGEYVVNKTLKGAVTAFIAKTPRQVAALRKVPGMDRVFDFDNPTQVERGIRIQRKGLPPQAPQQQPAAAPAAGGQPGAAAAVIAPPTPPGVTAGTTPPSSSPMTLPRPQGQTPANDTTAATDRSNLPPARGRVKGQGKPFSRSDIERQLVAAHQQEAVYGEYEDEKALGDFHAPFTFLHDPKTRSGLPGEVEHFLEGRGQLRARKFFSVTDNPADAQGADALAKLGQDRYFQMVDRQTGGRVRAAVEWATDHPDPQLQLLAAIHENMPAAKDRGPTQVIDPSAQPVGTRFKLFGHDFEIVEDADGHRLLKDGDDYPTLPADAIQRMPADKGSVRVEEPAVPEGDVFGSLEPEAPAATAAGQGLAPATSDTGIFGQEIYRPATGGRQGGLFHEPVEVVGHDGAPIAARRNALDPRHTAKLFSGGGPGRQRQEISRTGGSDGGTLSGDGPATGQPQPHAEPRPSLRRRDPQAEAGLSVRAGTRQAGGGPGEGGDTRQRLGQALRRHAPDGSVVHDTPDGWEIRHPDGTATPVRVRELDAADMNERAFAGALVAQHPGASLVAPDGRRVVVPDSVEGYNRLSPRDRQVLREGIRVGGQYDRARREIVLPPDADEDAIQEELFHAAFHRLPGERRKVVTDHFAEPGDSAADAEERAYRQYRRLPLTPFAGEPEAFEVLRSVRRGETFRQGGDGGGDPAGGEAEPTSGPQLLYNLRNPDRPRNRAALVRGGYVALPDLRGFLGELRHLRERFSVIESKDGPGLARAFVGAVQAGPEARTLYRSFARRAFDTTPDPARTARDFLAFGYHWRNQLLTAAGKAPTVPALPPAELARIQADPGVQNAVRLWNREFAPLIEDIRRRNGLPMSPRAGTVPLYLNLVGEMGPAEGDHSAAANLSPAFSRPAAGTGAYVTDPEEALTSALRGHLRTDAVNRLASEVRGVSIPMTDVKDPLGKRNPATQQPKPGQPYVGRYKGGWTKVTAVDLNPDQAFGKPDIHYVPERVAKAFNNLYQKPGDYDTLFDALLRGATRLGLIGDFAPHSLRVLFHVAGRIGQSGQAAEALAPWVGSLPAAAQRIRDMAKTPLGDAMQILVDRAGADRGAGYGLHEPGNALTRLLDVPHQLLMNPDYGVDPMARRVIADAHLRMVLGNPYMDRVEADLKAGRVTAAEAARGIEAALTPADVLALGRRVNATLGFANRQTRSGLLNDAQRVLPFISSESGMIPDEIRKMLTLNLNPAAVYRNVGRGQYARALVQLATMLTTGAVGTYLMMQGLNYASTKLWTGKGRWLDENDEGHKLDAEVYPGWYVGNFDPTFARASRLLGAKDLANHEVRPDAKSVAGTIGREGANEVLSALNSALRLAYTGASKLWTPDGQVPHLNPDGSIMRAKGGEWYPVGLLRNTVQEGVIRGKPIGPELTKDAVSLTTGLQIKQSAGRNYTPAERLAHEIATRDAGGGRELPPEERAKARARRELVDALRRAGANKGQLLSAARAAGTIDQADYSEVLREAKLTDLQRWVRGMTPEEAADVWDRATPAERDSLRDELRGKILGARHLSYPDQDRLLERAGITPPPELPVTRELHDLDAKASAYARARKKAEGILRQMEAARARGDGAAAEDLKAQAIQLYRENRMTPAESGRLELLRDVGGVIRQLRQRVEEGSMDRDRGEAQIRRLVARATRAGAAARAPAPEPAAAGKVE